MPKTKTVSLDEPLWTTSEVAAFLGLRPRSIHALRYSGRLPFIRYSHCAVRFVPEDVRKFAASLRVEGEAA